MQEERPPGGVIAFHAIVSVGLIVMGIGLLGGILSGLWIPLIVIAVVYYGFKAATESSGGSAEDERAPLPRRGAKARRGVRSPSPG